MLLEERTLLPALRDAEELLRVEEELLRVEAELLLEEAELRAAEEVLRDREVLRELPVALRETLLRVAPPKAEAELFRRSTLWVPLCSGPRK